MFFCISFFQLVFNLSDILFTNLFYIRENSLFHGFRCDERYHVVPEIFRCIKMLILMFFFTALCYNFVKELNDLSVQCMSSVNSFDHCFFCNFIGTGLDHDYLVTSRRYGKRKIRNFALFAGRVVY